MRFTTTARGFTCWNLVITQRQKSNSGNCFSIQGDSTNGKQAIRDWECFFRHQAIRTLSRNTLFWNFKWATLPMRITQRKASSAYSLYIDTTAWSERLKPANSRNEKQRIGCLYIYRFPCFSFFPWWRLCLSFTTKGASSSHVRTLSWKKIGIVHVGQARFWGIWNLHINQYAVHSYFCHEEKAFEENIQRGEWWDKGFRPSHQRNHIGPLLFFFHILSFYDGFVSSWLSKSFDFVRNG